MEKVRDQKHRDAPPRGVRAHALELKRLVADLGRLRPMKDPLTSVHVDLTPPQMHCLLWLGLDGPLPSRVLAQRIGCAQPNVTGIVDRLERSGLVLRERDGADRRVVRVKLTAAGAKLHTEVDRLVTKQLLGFLAAFSDADRCAFIDILSRVVDHFRTHPPHPDSPADSSED